VEHLPDGVAHFGKRLSSFSSDGSDCPIRLQFYDGSTATCDLLVGCDGIKSTIRRQMLEEKAQAGRPELLSMIDPVWTGTIAYRGLIPVERLNHANGKEHRTIQTPMMYCGKNKHVVSYSISRGSIVNVVALTSEPDKEGAPYSEPWVTDCTADELLDCYAGWEPEVIDLLKCIDKPTRWALHHLRPLPTYVSDRVCLLGDAAHAMSPHQGAGAGQAIEDAYMLARILGHPDATLSTLPHALLAYEHVRLPLANRVLQGSKDSGELYEFNGHCEDDLQTLGPAIGKQWDWLWETTPEREVERALAWMQGGIVQKSSLGAEI